MNVDRRILRSISEWSVFKYLLVGYLIFFILSLIMMGIIGVVTWLGLSSYGINLQDIISENFGIDLPTYTGGGIIGIILVIAGGFVASIFYAAVGTLALWIMNVVLRITGGIELRFLEQKPEEPTSLTKAD